jgi:septin family protein
VVPFVIASADPYCWLNSYEYATIVVVAELYRRWQWAIIRIENESVSNPERYRQSFLIPELVEPEKENKDRVLYENMLRRIGVTN